MAKIDLTSLFTSCDTYTILQLVKKLIAEVEEIDYTPQLYKHHVYLTVPNSGVNLYIVSTDKDPYESLDDIPFSTSSSLVSIAGNTVGHAMFNVKVDSDGVWLTINNTTITKIENVVSFTDTVSEIGGE